MSHLSCICDHDKTCWSRSICATTHEHNCWCVYEPGICEQWHLSESNGKRCTVIHTLYILLHTTLRITARFTLPDLWTVHKINATQYELALHITSTCLKSSCCTKLITSNFHALSIADAVTQLPVCYLCTSMQAVEDEQHFLFDCPFYSIIRGQHFSLFGPNYQQRDIRLFFEQNSHQLGFVAHHIHLCFQARMSDEPLLAPHPRL